MLTSLHGIFGPVVAATRIIVVLDKRQRHENMDKSEQEEVWPGGWIVSKQIFVVFIAGIHLSPTIVPVANVQKFKTKYFHV